MSTIRTCESTCIGHPDKLCDLIAETILDDLLVQDPYAWCAVEVMATRGQVIVAGEITSSARASIRASVRKALARAGYSRTGWRISVHVHRQSPDIAAGVDESLEARGGMADEFDRLGAGDQGTVYGYATDETPERLPLPLVLAHEICRRLDAARVEGAVRGVGCDGKAQVTLNHTQSDGSVRVAAVIVSVQHTKDTDLEQLRETLREQVVISAFVDHGLALDEDMVVLVNPAGPFTIGGLAADTGLTGRKLAVDTQGGLAPHGGSAFSGKDATKVHRSGAYMARLVARTIVDAGMANETTVTISYAIGRAEPLAVNVDTSGTGTVADAELADAVRVVFDLRPAAIIKRLDLRRPVFADHASYGHFTTESAWNTTRADLVAQLMEEVEAHGGPHPATV